MPYDQHGDFYPARRSEHRCAICRRHFAAHAVPVPDQHGNRICRDCRADQAEQLALLTGPPPKLTDSPPPPRERL